MYHHLIHRHKPQKLTDMISPRLLDSLTVSFCTAYVTNRHCIDIYNPQTPNWDLILTPLSQLLLLQRSVVLQESQLQL